MLISHKHTHAYAHMHTHAHTSTYASTHTHGHLCSLSLSQLTPLHFCSRKSNSGLIREYMVLFLWRKEIKGGPVDHHPMHFLQINTLKLIYFWNDKLRIWVFIQNLHYHWSVSCGYRDAKGKAMWLPCNNIAKILPMGQSLGF